MSLLNLQMPTAPVSSISRNEKVEIALKAARVRRDLNADFFFRIIAELGADGRIGFLQRVESIGSQNSVPFFIDENNEMRAFITLEIFDDVLSLLGEKLPALAALVLRIDGQGLFEDLSASGISLDRTSPGRRIREPPPTWDFLAAPSRRCLGLGNVPGVQ